MKITDTCTTEVHVRETDDGRVRDVIARCPVPFLRDAGRTELYQSVRHIGTYEHVSMTSRTDVWVNVLCQIGLFIHLRIRTTVPRHEQGTEGCYKKLFFHVVQSYSVIQTTERRKNLGSIKRVLPRFFATLCFALNDNMISLLSVQSIKLTITGRQQLTVTKGVVHSRYIDPELVFAYAFHRISGLGA